MELDIIFSQQLIKKGYVTIENFIKYAKRIQDIVNKIGHELDPQAKKHTYSLLIKDKREGSDIYTLIPQNDTQTFGTAPIDETIIVMKNIAKLIREDVDGRNHKKLMGIIENSNRRKKIFNDFHTISKYPGSFEILLKESTLEEPKKIFKPEKDTRKTLNTWKEMEIKKREEEFIGALTVIQAEGRVFLKLREVNGYSIKYNFIEKNLDKYHPHFKKIVKVRGLYNPVYNKLETIEEFELHDKVSLNELKDLKFKSPLELELEFHENGFFAKNSELNVTGVGETFEEMYEDLYRDIISAIDLYVNSRIELTSGAQKIKDRLISIVSSL